MNTTITLSREEAIDLLHELQEVVTNTFGKIQIVIDNKLIGVSQVTDGFSAHEIEKIDIHNLNDMD